MQRKSKTIDWNKTTIDVLKPPAVGHEHDYDTRTPGLCFCVSSTGHKAYYLVRRIGRKVERVKLRAWPRMTPDQARNKADHWNGRAAIGQNPAEEKRTAKGAPTLLEAFNEFIDAPAQTKKKRARSKRTKHEYRLQIVA